MRRSPPLLLLGPDCCSLHVSLSERFRRLCKSVYYSTKSTFSSFPSCLSSGANDEFQVVLGGVNIDKQEEMDQTIPVIRTIIHEQYRDARVAVYNDIGLPIFLTLFMNYPFFLNCYFLLHTISVFELDTNESNRFSS